MNTNLRKCTWVFSLLAITLFVTQSVVAQDEGRTLFPHRNRCQGRRADGRCRVRDGDPGRRRAGEGVLVAERLQARCRRAAVLLQGPDRPAFDQFGLVQSGQACRRIDRPPPLAQSSGGEGCGLGADARWPVRSDLPHLPARGPGDRRQLDCATAGKATLASHEAVEALHLGFALLDPVYLGARRAV